jgi:hypothetical protein
MRYEKSVSLLRLDGNLAVVSTTKHVHPHGGDDFFARVQEDYKAILPEHPDTKAGPPMGPTP